MTRRPPVVGTLHRVRGDRSRDGQHEEELEESSSFSGRCDDGEGWHCDEDYCADCGIDRAGIRGFPGRTGHEGEGYEGGVVLAPPST